MKKICLLAIAAGALLVPASASAKEITGLKVCGAAACTEVKDQAKLNGLMDEEPSGSSVFGPAVGPYYTVAMSFGDNGQTFDTRQTYWLAELGLLRGQEQLSSEAWWHAPAAQSAMLKQMTAGIQPFTPQLRRVLVGRKAVADPSSYMRLLERYPHPRARPSKKARWIKITLRGTNPWVDGVLHMRYQPQRRVLQRESDLVKLPKALGRLVVRRLSLAQPATSGKSDTTSSSHAGLYAGVGTAGLALAGLALVLRRKTK